MGRYKKIVTNIAEDKRVIIEKKIDIVDIILMVLVMVSLLIILVLRSDNQKLLEQVNEAMGDYNEISYQYDLLNNSYEELKEKYEYAIEVIRTSDKYDLPEGVEE